jgi:metal-responsive CopG/Arc/MetJ family transcriptional regulator
MSKRLQVVLPDDEYRALERAARRRRKPISQLVRDSLRQTVAQRDDVEPEKRIAAVLRFARFSGPTGDIGQLLAEIEQGRAGG